MQKQIIINEELSRLGWTSGDLALRRKCDPAKLAIANRLRRETVLTIPAIVVKLHPGSRKSTRACSREQKAKGRAEVRRSQRLNLPADTIGDVALLESASHVFAGKKNEKSGVF